MSRLFFKQAGLLCFLWLCYLSAFAGGAAPASDGRESLPQWMHHLYLGAEAGYSIADYSNGDMAGGYTATSFQNGGLGAHPFLGYQFNPNWAAEFAVFYMSRPAVNGIPTPGVTVKLRHNVVGLYLKGIYHPRTDWSLFIKGGLGYTARSQISVGATTVLPEGLFFCPLLSLGVAYEFAKQWFVDVSANFMFENSGDQLPMAQFYGVGIAYAFGSEYI